MPEQDPAPTDEGGTREYPAGTDEYPSDTDDPHAGTEEPPWWERAGFASLADTFAYERAVEDRVEGRKPRDLSGLSMEELLYLEPERPPKKRGSARPRSRQVNVKLTDDEHEGLKEAARSYGVSKATLARIFVVRATRIALKDDAD